MRYTMTIVEIKWVVWMGKYFIKMIHQKIIDHSVNFVEHFKAIIKHLGLFIIIFDNASR